MHFCRINMTNLLFSCFFTFLNHTFKFDKHCMWLHLQILMNRYQIFAWQVTYVSLLSHFVLATRKKKQLKFQVNFAYRFTDGKQCWHAALMCGFKWRGTLQHIIYSQRWKHFCSELPVSNVNALGAQHVLFIRYL